MSLPLFEIKKIIIEEFNADELINSPDDGGSYLVGLSIGVKNKKDNEVKITLSLLPNHNENKKPIVSISTIFEIENNYWLKRLESTRNRISFPKTVIFKLIDVAMGNLRGIIYARTYDEQKKRALVFSYIEPSDIINDSVILLFDSINEGTIPSL
ncbi:hypothetical protein [Petrimonas sulfuriphila]|uniref:hypothetical protein n=1 Tax=Petrimonas sulfuriphila TaxID=285070 RepID=UPI003EBB0B6E